MTKKFGLVLGGGGARGIAHLGILKVLEREGITVDYIAGTSMGALVGVMYASCMTLDQMAAEFKKAARKRTMVGLVDPGWYRKGLLKGNRFFNYVAKMLGPTLTFADLQIPVQMIATDILSGREVILKDGPVAEAIRATIAVPEIFRPVSKDGCMLVDGGILNNVPVDLARSMGAEVTLAIDVLPDFSPNQPGHLPINPPIVAPGFPAILQNAMHIQMVSVSALTALKLATMQPDLIIRPHMPPEISLITGYNRVDEVINAGTEAVEEVIPELKALLAGQVGKSVA